MEIVVAHNNTDFDSLASQFAVTKLYPGTRMAPSTSLTPNIREFLTLYRDSLPIVDLQYAETDKISHVYVVDCQQVDRLDDVPRRLISTGAATHTVFDHHSLDEKGLIAGAREDSEVSAIGSCTAMLVDKIIRKQMQLLPFEATLLLIGIYEDTGCMTYSGTTEMDAHAVAFLLSQGADLNQVNNFINPKLGEDQTELFQTLIANAETLVISGAKVILSYSRCEKFIEGLATLTRKLLEVSSANAAITVVWMRDRTHIVGRSDSPAISVRDIVRHYGGDGHHGAASAVTKESDEQSLLNNIRKMLVQNARPEPTAGELMISPVRTIKSDVAIDEAGKIMLRYGQDGLVIMQDDSVSGIVSKRDVDKALHHKLGHAPVRGFMSTPVITINPETPLSEIQSLMFENDIGRLPVVDGDGELCGIVTRKEVLSTLFGVSTATESKLAVNVQRRKIDFRDRLTQLDEATKWLFHTIGEVAADCGMAAYSVGGCVRDLYLQRKNFDLDFVLEGSAIILAESLEQAYPGRFKIIAKHDRFQTATLNFFADTVREVDLSTARIEFYEFPAALPTVEASVLEQDLFRRDFTINALALSLTGDEFGYVVDFFDGVADIDAKLIRVLHPFSFIEDPTRIIRAARFASRLGFELEGKTRQQADRAIAMGIFDNLGGSRLKEELRLILESPYRLAALELLNDLGGGLRYLASHLTFDDRIRGFIRRAERTLVRNRIDREWVVYLALLLAPLAAPEVESVMERLSLANEERDWIRAGLKLLGELPEKRDDTLARSQIYVLLHGHSEQSLAIAASLAVPGSPARRWIKLYLEELRLIRTSMSGSDLMRMGFPQGPPIKDALQKLHAARLDGDVQTPAQEFEFVKRNYPQYSGV
jgi:tRNA nucleotidyltransferase (CCA-adding enzyme)